MCSLLRRGFLMTVLLGLTVWSLSCSDGATEPTLPTGPAALDRAVLTVFYEATGGDDWTRNDSWLSAAPIGTWYGVTVGADDRVVGIRLPNNSLSGSIPAALGNLSSLEELSLSINDLNGRIPPELGNLSEPVNDFETLYESG